MELYNKVRKKKMSSNLYKLKKTFAGMIIGSLKSLQANTKTMSRCGMRGMNTEKMDRGDMSRVKISKAKIQRE